MHLDLLFYFVLSVALVAGLIALFKWAQAEDRREYTRNRFKDIVSDIGDPDD